MKKNQKAQKPKKRKIGGVWYEEKITKSIELVPTNAPELTAAQKNSAERLKQQNAEIARLYNAKSNVTVLMDGTKEYKKTYQEVQKEYFAKKGK